jgi:hypothetical protein
MVDAGISNAQQMTKKGAANFLRWKFIEELERKKVSLENALLTHPDADHYGGFTDVLSGDLKDGHPFQIEVKNFYHPGIGRFKDEPKLGKTTKGKADLLPSNSYGIAPEGEFITELLSGKTSFKKPAREFDKAFATVAALIGKVPKNVKRISHLDRFLPGYTPDENACAIRILGPILETLGSNKSGLRVFSNESITRNGHSVVLRLDYGKARILLTGDLNRESQELLLSYHRLEDLLVDVAKGCHHGSEDILMNFLKALHARTTIISSGDNEDYSHPRPLIIGASGFYGRQIIDEKGKELPPLIYSTELARSVKLSEASVVRKMKTTNEIAAAEAEVKAKSLAAKYRPLSRTPISTGLLYGLVNVRTDGEHILCATMEEKGNDFDVKVFKAG